MTVKELITKLQKLPPNADVVCYEKGSVYEWKPKSVFLEDNKNTVMVRNFTAR